MPVQVTLYYVSRGLGIRTLRSKDKKKKYPKKKTLMW